MNRFVLAAAAALVCAGLAQAQVTEADLAGDATSVALASGGSPLVAADVADVVAARVVLDPSTGAVTAAPAPAADLSGDRNNAGLAGSAVGQLFGTEDGQDGACTATVVASTSGSVLATAGHCVFQDGQWAQDIEFIPGRDGRRAPYGRWKVDSVAVDQRWAKGQDWSHDVAFLRLAPQSGKTVAAVTGAQGISFSLPADQPAVTLLGYPGEAPFDGTTLRRCSAPAAATDDPAGARSWGMACEMTAGFSGGPVLTDLDPVSGAGYVIGVGSHYRLASNDRWSARLDDDALALYHSMDTAAPA